MLLAICDSDLTSTFLRKKLINVTKKSNLITMITEE